MHFALLLLLISFLGPVLGVKELPGEELPSKDNPNPILEEEQVQAYIGDVDEGQNQMVKRSISDIAARRRSALDKSFMRFGRSDPDMPSGPRMKMNNANLMRFGRSKQSGFLRLGRARSSDFLRFGRSPGNLMRFGRSPGNLMRFGRSGGNLMRFGRANNNLMRFGRANNNLMRFGRANNNLMRFGRANNNLMRFGRANNNLMRFGRASSNLMRFGRSDDDSLNYDEPNTLLEEINEDELNPTTTSDGYVRVERDVKDVPESKGANYVDRKNDNFMRLGRSLLEKNYDDEEESDMEDNFNNDKLSSEKLKMYLDDNFARIGDSDSQGDAFDQLFPEDARKKRSLVKQDAKDIKVEGVEMSDVSSVRHVHSDDSTRCST